MGYNFKHVKILVVENSPALLEILNDVLCIFTVPRKNIYCASTMQEGFTKFCMMNHDLVLTAWLKEPETGLQLASMIRRHRDSPNNFVPIIIAAGSAHKRSVLAARDAGISEYLVMPCNAHELAKKITRAIEFPRPFVASDAYVGPDRRFNDAAYTGPERRHRQEDRRSA